MDTQLSPTQSMSCRQCGYSMSVHRKTEPLNPSESSTSGWITTAEAAAYLKMKTRMLLILVRQGKIKGHPLSGTRRHVWRFRREDLDAALLASAVLSSDRQLCSQ
jgi:excisionase family DNA binding protein